MDRKDWWLWKLHIIRYRLQLENYYGWLFIAPKRYSGGYKKSFEVFTGKHVWVFYWVRDL
jgi:hypothetical protein